MQLQNSTLAEFLATCTRLRYVRHVDTLYLFLDHLEGGLATELGDNFAYRVSWDGTRIVAVEVRNFRRIVLKENAALAKAWRAYRSPMRRLLLRLFA